MELNLKNKIVLVTGASKGLGKAIAEEMAIEGASVALCARNLPELEKVADSIHQRIGTNVLVVPEDLRTLEGVTRAAQKVLEHFGGKIDVLINNAGAVRAGSLLTKPDQDWFDDWSLKVFGYIRLTREIFPTMQRQGNGRIINVIGITGYQPILGYLAAGMANAALINMTKALADEGAPFNVLVNAINPGPIRTERHFTMVKTVAAERNQTAEAVEAGIMENYRIGRLGEPREVAALAAFLASSRATYINGAIIPVDGGGLRCI